MNSELALDIGVGGPDRPIEGSYNSLGFELASGIYQQAAPIASELTMGTNDV